MSTYGTLWEQVRHERDMLKELGITNTGSRASAQAEYAKLKEAFAAKCREIESRLANWAEIEKDMDKPDGTLPEFKLATDDFEEVLRGHRNFIVGASTLNIGDRVSLVEFVQGPPPRHDGSVLRPVRELRVGRAIAVMLTSKAFQGEECVWGFK